MKKLGLAVAAVALVAVPNTPMLAVPRWLERARAQKEPIVVKALNSTARGVLPAIRPAPPLRRARETM